MRRFRIALLAGLATLALGAISVPVAAASNGTTVPPKSSSVPALKTISICPTSNCAAHGVAKNGKKFTGTYAIQGFVAGANKVYAVGTLKGMLKGRHVTRYNVKMPVTLTGPPANAAQTAATCTVLDLTLGPIDLNLLGLRVQLFGDNDPQSGIQLLITANSNQGILGQLLCGLTQNLGGTGILGQLSNNLQQLAATLTSLTSILGAL